MPAGGQATNGLKATIAAAAVALLLVFASAAYGDTAPGTDFRVSNMGPDGDAAFGGFQAAAAYNSTAHEYLVVWHADNTKDEEFEIWGRRVSETGDPIGSQFQISHIGTDGDALRKGLDPAVAYNVRTNSYLVAWYGNQPIVPQTPEKHYEIWGHLVSGAGAPTGSDFQISTTGANTSPTRAVLRHPAVAADPDPTNPRFLVVWSGNPLTDPQLPQLFGKYEIFGQLINASNGLDVGTDFRISNTGAEDSQNGGFLPAIAYNSIDREYLVAWYGNGLQASGEFEIFGQRVSLAGAQVPNPTDIRISNVGAEGNGLREPNPSNPSIAYNSNDDEYLVTWTGNNLPALQEYEAWGQRLSAAGAQIPTPASNFRISNVGPDGNTSLGAFEPTAAYNPNGNEYVVAWFGNAGKSVEACGQHLSAAGTEVGGDFQISNMDAAGDGTRAGFSPDIVFNPHANSLAGEYFAAWEGDGDGLADDEFEIFARRLESAPKACVAVSAPSPPTLKPPGPSTPPPPTTGSKALKLTASASTVQRLRNKVIVLLVSCDQACSLSASGRISIRGTSKTYKLRSLKKSLAAGKRVTLRFKLSAKIFRAAKRALAKHKRVSATVNLIAKNAAGRRASRHVIRLRR
jgi:hypothetical protein